MIPNASSIKKEVEAREIDYQKKLLNEFNDFMEGRFPPAGTLSSPCPDKFLSARSLIKEEYAHHGWDIDFDVTFSCGEIVCNRVVIKAIK